MIVRSADGTLIFCESHCVPAPKGALLVVHGLGEHAGRYTELVEQAGRLGLNVHLLDLRGHGRSTGTRGHFQSLEELHADLDVWLAHLVAANELSDRVPCVLLGHSLGGLIAASYAASYVARPPAPPFAGLILSNPCFGLRKSPLQAIEAQIARSLPGFLRNFQVPNGIDTRQLSHDPEEIERYEEDPLVHRWITPAAFQAIERAIEKLPTLVPALSVPILFLLGGKDKVVDVEASKRIAGKLGIAHPGLVEVKLFHSFFHEPFHELRRERAFLELKKWLLQRILPSSRAKRTSSGSSGRGATAKGTSP